MSAIEPLVKNIQSQLLTDDWYTLKKYTFDLQRRDGEWQRQQREVDCHRPARAVLR